MIKKLIEKRDWHFRAAAYSMLAMVLTIYVGALTGCRSDPFYLALATISSYCWHIWRAEVIQKKLKRIFEQKENEYSLSEMQTPYDG